MPSYLSPHFIAAISWCRSFLCVVMHYAYWWYHISAADALFRRRHAVDAMIIYGYAMLRLRFIDYAIILPLIIIAIITPRCAICWRWWFLIISDASRHHISILYAISFFTFSPITLISSSPPPLLLPSFTVDSPPSPLTLPVTFLLWVFNGPLIYFILSLILLFHWYH